MVLDKVHNDSIMCWHDDAVWPVRYGAELPGMKYTVKPAIVEGCDCADCNAGRHLYYLYRCPVKAGNWSALSLHTYSSAEDCKRNHCWGLDFGPEDTWEDGSQIVQPKPMRAADPDGRQPGTVGMVPLNAEALQKSANILERHWCPQDLSR